MTCIEGVVLAVPNANRDDYIRACGVIAEIFKENGATRYVECWGVDVPDGDITSFPKAVKCKDDETVCFSWIEWPSKSVRDKAMPKVMSDKRMNDDNMPFDATRLVHGLFEVISDV